MPEQSLTASQPWLRARDLVMRCVLGDRSKWLWDWQQWKNCCDILVASRSPDPPDSNHNVPCFSLATGLCWMQAENSWCNESWAPSSTAGVHRRLSLHQTNHSFSVLIKHWLQRSNERRSKILHFEKMEKTNHCITWPKFTVLQLLLTSASSLRPHTHAVQPVHKNQSSTSYSAECVLHAVQQGLMMENSGISFHLCPAQTFLPLRRFYTHTTLRPVVEDLEKLSWRTFWLLCYNGSASNLTLTDLTLTSALTEICRHHRQSENSPNELVSSVSYSFM